MKNKRLLKKGSSILIKNLPPTRINVKNGEVWTVAGFNHYMGEETYRLIIKMDEDICTETHGLVEEIDRIIRNGDIEIIQK